MEEKLLDPEEVIRLRIAIRERRRNRFSADVQPAREGVRATSLSDSTQEALEEDSTEASPGSGESGDSSSVADEILDLSSLTSSQIKDRLKARGVEFPANAKKADLLELLKQAGD